MNNIAFGRSGERAAKKYLLSNGAKVLCENYRCPMGELDLIVEMDGAIVFVEVKARNTRRHGRPALAVDGKKQSHIARSAMWYLKKEKIRDCHIRFDVIEVLEDEICHLKGAFYPNTR